MRTDAQRIAQAMIDTLEVRDIENGFDISKLLTAGFTSAEIMDHIDHVREQVLARRVRYSGAFSAGVAACVVLLLPPPALASFGDVSASTAWGIGAVCAFVGAAFGFGVCAMLSVAREADDRSGVCPYDQRLSTGSCLTCGAQRGDRCRGEGV